MDLCIDHCAYMFTCNHGYRLEPGSSKWSGGIINKHVREDVKKKASCCLYHLNFSVGCKWIKFLFYFLFILIFYFISFWTKMYISEYICSQCMRLLCMCNTNSIQMLTYIWMEAFHVGFQYVPPELFSYLMSHLCCMATTFPTNGKRVIFFTFSLFHPLFKN